MSLYSLCARVDAMLKNRIDFIVDKRKLLSVRVCIQQTVKKEHVTQIVSVPQFNTPISARKKNKLNHG